MLEDYKRPNYKEISALNISESLKEVFQNRRTIRHFSKDIPPINIIKNAIDSARFAPSGANKQPWEFDVIHRQSMKEEIRDLAEKEEELFYETRPNKTWVKELSHLHTNKRKEFITQAPYLIIIFFKHFDFNAVNEKSMNYYAKESCGIATGMLISALHLSGLSTLTYTPRNMQFLSKLLNKSKEQKPFMVLATGLPDEQTQVPSITKKCLDEILTVHH